MIAGVPGVGITGVFYLILTLLMPLREAWYTLTGRSSLARWGLVLTQTSIAVGVVLSLSGEYWLITQGFGYVHRHVRPHSTLAILTATDAAAVAPSLTLAPFIALGAILLTVQALRFLLPDRQPPPVAPLTQPI